METSFDNDDDDFDGDDDDDDFDGVIDSDGDGFSDEYEELLGSDPQDPTDLPFYPPEVEFEPFPRKKETKPIPIVEEENKPPIRIVKGSPTRNRCLLLLILFMILFALTPIIIFLILS
ncbi:MAG: hypothetical protein EAX91_07025 [Candidatus Lokiarchaeota archaeon]|nr:hypothetical protein [Candidatus Lokiarchaeota archaeon]